MITKILKNNTGSDLFILTRTVPNLGEYQVPVSLWDQLLSDEDLMVLITSGDLIVNNGTIELSASEGLKHVLKFDEEEVEPLKCADLTNTTAITMGTNWTDVTLESERKLDSPYSHVANSSEIAVLEASTYKVTYDLGIETTSGGTRSQTEGRLVLNGVEVPNSNSEQYNRTSSKGGDSSSRSFILDLQANDILKLQARRQSGGNTQKTISGASGIVIVQLQGSKGEKGDPGNGEIVVENNGVQVGSNPFDTLNFSSEFVVSDDTDKATISLAQGPQKQYYYMQYAKMGVMDFDQYLYSWNDTDKYRSSSSNGFEYEGSCPILMPFSGNLIKANFAIKGVAVSTGTPDSIITVKFELWSVGFSSEGTKLSDVDVQIDSSQFTIGTYWNSFVNTDFKGTINLNIPILENDMLALKFNSISGSSNCVEVREVLCNLTLES